MILYASEEYNYSKVFLVSILVTVSVFADFTGLLVEFRVDLRIV